MTIWVYSLCVQLLGKKMRKFSLFVLGFAALWFVWYLVGDRVTPYTSGARVKAFVVPIVPQVSGYVTKVNVANNSPVKQNELLIEINQKPYKIAVEKAEADLELAGQTTGAQTASVDSAEARLVEARAKLANAEAQGKRTFDLEKQGFATGRRSDSARAQIAEGKARVKKAEADLEAAESTAGQEGYNSANLRAARTALAFGSRQPRANHDRRFAERPRFHYATPTQRLRTCGIAPPALLGVGGKPWRRYGRQLRAPGAPVQTCSTSPLTSGIAQAPV